MSLFADSVLILDSMGDKNASINSSKIIICLIRFLKVIFFFNSNCFKYSKLFFFSLKQSLLDTTETCMDNVLATIFYFLKILVLIKDKDDDDINRKISLEICKYCIEATNRLLPETTIVVDLPVCVLLIEKHLKLIAKINSASLKNYLNLISQNCSKIMTKQNTKIKKN